MKVIRWIGYRNSDTNTIEGGYLFIRYPLQIIGHQIRHVTTRAEAIKKYLQDYEKGKYKEYEEEEIKQSAKKCINKIL